MNKIIQISKVTILSAAIISLFNGCGKKDTPSPANVTSSVTVASKWEYSSPEYYYDIAVSELTSSNKDEAAVMVYCNAGDDTWRALPYTQYSKLESNYYMAFNTDIGKVQITWISNSSTSQGDNPNIYYGNTVKFKVVVIPPNARVAVDLRDYEAVREEFGLKD